jgi:putative transposase
MDRKLSAGDDLWNLAVKREAVLRNLLQKDTVTADDVNAGCQKLGIRPALLYRLLSRYKNDQRASALLPQKRGRREGSSPLSDEVGRLIDRAIQTHYLSAQKPRISKLVQFIASESHKARLPCPSRTAIEKRLKTIDTRTLLHSREGLKAANDKTRPVTGSLIAEYPLQIIQVDHTKIDVFVVDEKHRLPIQRPWLTLLIDVATRMVTGYHLSLEAPSSVSLSRGNGVSIV